MYDSTSSSYINMDTILRLIREGVDICVIEDETGKDITNNILLQSILDSNETVQLFPTSLLHRLIRLQSKQDVEHAVSNKLAETLQMLDAQLSRLEKSGWMASTNWNPFSNTDSPPNNVHQKTEVDDHKATPETREDNVVDSDNTDGAEQGPKTVKKTVAEQQLDSIRSHIASLEARLRKK